LEQRSDHRGISCKLQLNIAQPEHDGPCVCGIWNASLQQGPVSRRIALRHWRTTHVALAFFNYTAARLAFEAQNAAFRFLRASRGIPKTSAADEIDLEALAPPASTTPAPVVVTRRTRQPQSRHRVTVAILISVPETSGKKETPPEVWDWRDPAQRPLDPGAGPHWPIRDDTGRIFGKMPSACGSPKLSAFSRSRWFDCFSTAPT
jgi:hypothetical protein